MYADVYEKLQPALGGNRFGKKRIRLRKRPSTSPAKLELEVNTMAERGRRYSLNRLRSRQNASPSPLHPRKSRKGSRRRVRSLSPRKRRSIIKQIDEIQDALRRMSDESGLKILEHDDLSIPLPLGRSPGRSDSLPRYFSFPIQRSPSPYYSFPSVPRTRSPTPSLPPLTAVAGLPAVPSWSLHLIKTPRHSRSPSADLCSHTMRTLSMDRTLSQSSQNILDEGITRGRGDSEEDHDAGITLPYGSPEVISVDTLDDFKGLTMDALKRRLAEALTDLEIERAHRLEIDQILRDVERECRQPCVVPSLILAVKDFSSFRESL